MRTTSEFWVSAYIRTRNGKNKPSVLVRRGAKEAGAIYIQIDHLDGSYDLYTPASQLAYDESVSERLFRLELSAVNVLDIMDRMEREKKFDPDFWLIESECHEGSHDLCLANEDE